MGEKGKIFVTVVECTFNNFLNKNIVIWAEIILMTGIIKVK